MSLTTLLKNRDIKEELRKAFPKPIFRFRKEILAQPLTNHYLSIGTSFDYLMRFYLKRMNPKAITFMWIAEKAQLHTYSLMRPTYDIDTDELTDNTSPENKRLIKTAEKIINDAHANYDKYLKTGRMSNNLIKSSLLLSHLDPLFRGGYVDSYIVDNFGSVDEKDIKDLKEIISLVDPNIFKAKKVCLLNPTFGKASNLVGGADVDLVIDDMIIDIKTTKNLEFTRDFFNQIMGYFVLYKIGGIDNLPAKHNINRLGIYYARYGFLCIINVKDIIDDKSLSIFIKWFKKRVNKK